MQSSGSLEQLCQTVSNQTYCCSVEICSSVIFTKHWVCHTCFFHRKNSCLYHQLKPPVLRRARLSQSSAFHCREGTGSCSTACSHRPVCSPLLHCEHAWLEYSVLYNQHTKCFLGRHSKLHICSSRL